MSGLPDKEVVLPQTSQEVCVMPVHYWKSIDFGRDLCPLSILCLVIPKGMESLLLFLCTQ